MTDMGAHPPLHPPPNPGVGDLLQHFRERAGLSQLHLALAAGVSTRHLSYVETGKARASAAALARVADVLRLSDAERNTLRIAAGFRARARPRAGEAPQAPPIRAALDLILASATVPTLVKDRNWDVVDQNRLADDLLFALAGVRYSGRPEPLNVLELVFSPDLLRPRLANWREVAQTLVARVRLEVGFAADSPEFVRLVNDLGRLDAFRDLWRAGAVAGPPGPSTVYRYTIPGGEPADFEVVVTSLGAPHETVLNGLRIDSFYPRNAAATAMVERLRAPPPEFGP